MSPAFQRGALMIEVLVTMVILAFGLLGLVGLQAKVQVAELESYQRAQAIVFLNDMVDRINANRTTADTYVPTAGVNASVSLGTGVTDASPCPSAVGPARDECEWSVALKGAAEKQSSTNIGAMLGARGCIERLQIPNAAAGVCTPGIYRVTVAWQGLTGTATPSATCGSGSYGGNDAFRRAVSSRVVIGLPQCS